MKHISTSITLLLFILSFTKLVAKEPQKVAERTKELTTNEIIRAEVIGKLGLPLGTCVDVQATVEAAKKPTSKQNSGKYFLKITHVSGKKLAIPLFERFYIHHFASETVQLADSEMSLYKLKKGQPEGWVDSDEIKKLEDDYLSKVVYLTVYENGGFRGVPKNLPKSVRVWPGVGYGFSSEVCVIDQKEKKTK